MTLVNPKSISGINSITTGSGSDNLLTIHTSDASSTERVRINSSGDVIVGSGITVSPDGDIFTTGVTTATTFVGALTGNVTGNATGLSGTPNISAGTIAGSTGTFTGDVSIPDKIVHTGDTNTAIRFPEADTFSVETSGTQRFRVEAAGNVNFANNVNVSGTSTVTGIAQFANTINLTHASAGSNYIYFNEDIQLARNGTGTRLKIASNGDFGFNDTAPTAHASGNNTVLSLKGKGSSYSGKIDFKDSDGNLDSYINSDNATLQIYCDPNSQNGNTAMNFSVHGSNRMRIGAGGDVDVETGDIFFSTAGKGIVLGNTSNTDANTLDDYEEGTFTPVMKFGGGNTGMSLGNVEAVYTKIGRMVYATIRFTMSGKGSSTGQLTFEGLPHTVGDVLSTTSVQGGFDLQYLQGNVNAHEIKVYPWESTSTLKAFKRSNQNSTTSDFTDSDISGQFDGRISFFYTADN